MLELFLERAGQALRKADRNASAGLCRAIGDHGVRAIDLLEDAQGMAIERLAAQPVDQPGRRTLVLWHGPHSFVPTGDPRPSDPTMRR